MTLSKAFAGFLVIVFGLLITTAIIAYGTWANAVVLTYLWQWFVTPVFSGVPDHLTTLQAAGLGLIISYLTKQNIKQPENEKESKTIKYARAVLAFAAPWITLLVGYVIHSL